MCIRDSATDASLIREASSSNSASGMPFALSALAGRGVMGTTSSPRCAGGWEAARPAIAPPRALLRSRTVL
eukprot:15447153-Alexandrium_andersonii.AAC.1